MVLTSFLYHNATVLSLHHLTCLRVVIIQPDRLPSIFYLNHLAQFDMQQMCNIAVIAQCKCHHVSPDRHADLYPLLVVMLV